MKYKPYNALELRTVPSLQNRNELCTGNERMRWKYKGVVQK